MEAAIGAGGPLPTASPGETFFPHSGRLWAVKFPGLLDGEESGYLWQSPKPHRTLWPLQPQQVAQVSKG